MAAADEVSFASRLSRYQSEGLSLLGLRFKYLYSDYYASLHDSDAYRGRRFSPIIGAALQCMHACLQVDTRVPGMHAAYTPWFPS